MFYVCLGLAALFGGLMYITSLAVRQAQEQVFHENIALAKGMARDVVRDFEFMASDLEVAMENLGASKIDFQSAADSLYRSIQAHAARQFFKVSSISILDEYGNRMATSPVTAKIPLLPKPEEIRLAAVRNEMSLLRPPDDPEAGNRFALVVIPFSARFGGERPVTIIAETIGLEGILPIIPGGEAGFTMEIIDVKGGTVVAASETGQVGKQSPHYDILEQHITAGSDGVAIDRTTGTEPAAEKVIAVTPLPNSPFYLTLEQPSEIALAIPHRLRGQILAIGLISLPLLLGGAWFTTRRVVRPLEQLRTATRAIASGNLDDPISVIAQDEVADLVKDAEAMRQQLKKSLNEIEQANSKLENTVAERTQRLSELLGKIIGAQERERQRLAREIHDEQSQDLSALQVMLNRIGRLPGGSSNEIKAEIEQAQNMTQRLLNETRRLIYDLRPSVLDDMGLEAAIRWCAETHLEKNGMNVTIQNSLNTRRLDSIIEVALFRVAQEAIVNIERHSRARNVDIALVPADSALRMRISDDGEGFVRGSKASTSQTSGLGLQGMEERVRLIGGNIDIVSTIGQGTIIEVIVPLNRGGAA